MEHFYTKINGWLDFQNTYTRMVNEHSDGAHFVEVGTPNVYEAVNELFPNDFQVVDGVSWIHRKK
jgi:hypothetical protein